MKFMNKEMLDEAKILHKDIYADMTSIIKIPTKREEQFIWDLVSWGLKTKEPLG